MAKQKNNAFIKDIQSQISNDMQIAENQLRIASEDISIFYIDSLIDKKLFSDGILSPLEKLVASPPQTKDLLAFIETQAVSVSGVQKPKTAAEAIDKILAGNVVIVLNGGILAYPVYGLQARSVAEPPTSRVVKGPREGFVEDLPKNLGMIRKRLKTTNLKIKELFVGKQTNTMVSVVWLDGIAKAEIVDEVVKRISKIEIDAIIDAYYVESFLETNRLKFFRRVGNTEKPDVLCSKILEGRVAILVDGSPIVLTVPFMLFEDLQSPQDYYTIPAQASFVRIMRLLGLIFAILMPGIYVALESFNYRILPINFLITLLSNIEGLSVPPLIELLLVLFLFEVITEASLQMPNALGMALSIIGALALGNTAVDAGIISPPSIVIVAISSVALYIIPDQISETRLLRILFTVVGGIVGLYGILTSFMILTIYLCSIKSFGVPYMTPLAPNISTSKHDTFFKDSVQNTTQRPQMIVAENKTRVGKYDMSDFKTEDELARLTPQAKHAVKQGKNVSKKFETKQDKNLSEKFEAKKSNENHKNNVSKSKKSTNNKGDN